MVDAQVYGGWRMYPQIPMDVPTPFSMLTVFRETRNMLSYPPCEVGRVTGGPLPEGFIPDLVGKGGPSCTDLWEGGTRQGQEPAWLSL